MPSVLVTGANRGLGLEFVRQYAAGGWRVFACCRKPAAAAALQEIATDAPRNVTVHQLEVTDHPRIEALATEFRAETLDLLLNNAGVYEPKHMVIGQIDYQSWANVFAVNTMAPLKMVECFVEQVAHSDKKLIVSISSQMGSIAENTDGGHYLYRSTKAALNMVVKSVAIDLQPRGITAVVLHPGWVQTDMGGPTATLKIPDSVRGMVQVIDGLTMGDSGQFISYDGSRIPW